MIADFSWFFMKKKKDFLKKKREMPPRKRGGISRCFFPPFGGNPCHFWTFPTVEGEMGADFLTFSFFRLTLLSVLQGTFKQRSV